MSDWKDCTALEAHQAFVAGAHDAEKKTTTNSALQGMWQHVNGVFIDNNMWQYRIRERAKMITVEIPCPAEGKISVRGVGIWLTFATQAQCDAAFKAITAAQEGEMKTKRVLIVVEADLNGNRWSKRMEIAVNAILASGFCADMWSKRGNRQCIYDDNGFVVAECESAKFLPKRSGNCPPKFVMELPAHLVRKGVPTYRGKIK